MFEAVGTHVSSFSKMHNYLDIAYLLYSALSGTTVDSEPNFLKKVDSEPGAGGEVSSGSCLRVDSLRWKEGILTLLRLRMKPVEEAPTKRGRSKGRQAPTMPRDDSTMGQ